MTHRSTNHTLWQAGLILSNSIESEDGVANACLVEMAERIKQFDTAVRNWHSAKGRYHSQIATCNLLDLCGIPNVRPEKKE